MGALKNEYAVVLRHLRSSGIRRFAAHPNGTLNAMWAIECLLDPYTPRYAAHTGHGYYKVPGYVWRRIDKRDPGAVPPWLNDIRSS